MKKKKIRIGFMVVCLVLLAVAVYGKKRITGTDQMDTGHAAAELENLPICKYTQQEIEVYNNGQKIYGIAYIPDTGAEKVPLMICSHGLGGSYQSNIAYAEQLAFHGIAAYCFDFRGGGGSRSDGDTTEMSVLMYPAFLVSDSIHARFDSMDEVPDSFLFEWITAGRPYAEDMWDYDVYGEIGNYGDKVLLMHGNADGIVPISYSERAAEVYTDVEYYVIDGAGHGFNGEEYVGAFQGNHIGGHIW